MRDESSPSDWLEYLEDRLELDRAYHLLDGYRHFHTSTLRGKVRILQNRPVEAAAHLRRSEELFERLRDPSRRDRIRFLYQRYYQIENAQLVEAMRDVGMSVASHDIPSVEGALSRFLDYDPLDDDPLLYQIKLYWTGRCHLHRGDYHAALKIFEVLLKEGRYRFETQQVLFSCGAAAAARELGLDENAERHYENTVLGANMATKKYKEAIFYNHLYVLMTRWGRDREAADWLARIHRIECPESARRAFLEKARICAMASRKRDTIVML